MTTLQLCEIVKDPSGQIRPTPTEQYEIPDDLPDDLSTIDVDAFVKLSDDDTTPLASPTPTTLASSVTPPTPSAASVTPAIPLAASVTPAIPLAASVTPATPLAASVTPATPCATDVSEVSVGEEIIHTCVTPSKVKGVETMLKVEKQRHLCALKLL